MKLKYFMRGLGTGIIFTTMVLAFSYQNHPKQELTDAQIVQRAKELGMVSQEQEDKKIDKSLDTIETENEKESEQPSVAPSVKPSSAATASTTATVSPTVSPASTKKPTSTPLTEKSADVMSLKIERGMLSGEVAAYFKKAGVIQDADKFNKYLNDHDFASKIIAGKYYISKDDSYYEIATKITSN